jgi:hypothetical protein
MGLHQTQLQLLCKDIVCFELKCRTEGDGLSLCGIDREVPAQACYPHEAFLHPSYSFRAFQCAAPG